MKPLKKSHQDILIKTFAIGVLIICSGFAVSMLQIPKDLQGGVMSKLETDKADTNKLIKDLSVKLDQVAINNQELKYEIDSLKGKLNHILRLYSHMKP